MHIFRLPLVALAALLLWVAPSLAQTTAAPVASAPAAAAQGKSFIWTIERDGRVGWLVGSLHLLTPDFYPLPDAMESAFSRADTLVEEVDTSEASDPALAALVLAKGLYPAGTTLSTQVSEETLARLRSWLMSAGLTVAPFEQMKPWMIALTLQTLALQRLGFDPALGLDRYFRDASIETGKGFIALETAAEQIDFLDALSPRTQDLMLRESIESSDTDMSEITTIANAWRDGDVETVEQYALGTLADAPEVYRSLLVDRNHRWMPAIESCVRTRRCFIVVGAAHLVGPDGLVTLLRDQGYTVSQQ
jgi:hypothetical protein